MTRKRNKFQVKDYDAKRYKECKAAGICTMCKQRAAQPDKQLCGICLEYQRKRHQIKAAGYREAIFNHYGTSCKCCGEPEEKFLTIDHINGGGNQERKKLKKTGVWFYKWLIENGYPEGFQTLCMNCNYSKGVWGKCPHQKEE